MTSAAHLFNALVAQGMARAYQAASTIEGKYPEWSVEPAIVADGALDEADPANLPRVRFIIYDDEGDMCDVLVNLHCTGRTMYRRVAANIESLAREEAGCA